MAQVFRGADEASCRARDRLLPCGINRAKEIEKTSGISGTLQQIVVEAGYEPAVVAGIDGQVAVEAIGGILATDLVLVLVLGIASIDEIADIVAKGVGAEDKSVGAVAQLRGKDQIKLVVVGRIIIEHLQRRGRSSGPDEP